MTSDSTAPGSGAEASAPVSLRTISWLEVASVTMSILITTWALIPLQLHYRWLVAVPGLLALALIIHSHRVRGETLRAIGFNTRHFGKALALLSLPMLFGGTLFLLAGYWTGTLNIKPHFWRSAALLPAWGLIQQYVLQAFVYRRFRFILGRPAPCKEAQTKRVRLAILFTALLFALVHAPNPLLMGLALAGGLVWSWAYERAPNLFALGISHALMSAIILLSLPQNSMRIGFDYFIFQGL